MMLQQRTLASILGRRSFGPICLRGRVSGITSTWQIYTMYVQLTIPFMRSSLFWDVKQRKLVVSDRRFEISISTPSSKAKKWIA
jgi:hypothetical protein